MLFYLFLKPHYYVSAFSESNQENLYHSLLKDSCNTLVGLATLQYLVSFQSTDPLSRAEDITKTFKTLLERDFITHKKLGYYTIPSYFYPLFNRMRYA